jgi:hypothetical protein
MHYAMRMRHIVIYELSRSTIFLHIILETAQLLNILRWIERVESKILIGLLVKYQLFLYDFNETWVFAATFLKILKYQI